MTFGHFRLDVNESNAFVLGCPATRRALLVDAGEYPEGLDDFLNANQLRLSTVFITHDHYDHVDGLAEILARYPAKVYAAKRGIGGCAAEAVKHGDVVRVGELEGKVLSTPGHTPDGLSLAFPDRVFTGDALFAGSVGGTASPELARQQLDAIRTHIFTLPPDTLVHTGHGPSSTVAIESRFNPFFV